jgi:hypothetical protein
MIAIALVLALAAADQAPPGPTPNPQPIQSTQEIAREQPEGPAIMAGTTEIRIGGYLGVTGIFRSTSGGGGPSTNFGTIPYSDTADGSLSEARLSAQSSRLSIRVNAAPAPGRATLAGYFEMDFAGAVPGNVAVTATSVGFRLRNAFGEGQFRGRFLIAAGQAYTLMTPAKNQLSIWPSDYDLTDAVDMNYVAGMMWGRVPQVRFTYRPSPGFNWALSVENPEQQIGNGEVTLPSCCGELSEQYNNGSNGLDTANLMPDIVSRVAFNRGQTLHVDAGGVVRVFRQTLKPYNSSMKQVGGGVSANARYNATTTSHLLAQLASGAGLGRYIGGLVPDVSFGADGAIHPIHTISWVAGFEQRISDHTAISVYDSGVHPDANYSIDVDGHDIGFGYPGAPRPANKTIHEITGVYAWRPWQIENRGSLQWTTQLSWLTRTPWPGGTGPSSADALLFFTQLRYNLP